MEWVCDVVRSRIPLSVVATAVASGIYANQILQYYLHPLHERPFTGIWLTCILAHRKAVITTTAMASILRASAQDPPERQTRDAQHELCRQLHSPAISGQSMRASAAQPSGARVVISLPATIRSGVRCTPRNGGGPGPDC